jgi:hypothetical protein
MAHAIGDAVNAVGDAVTGLVEGGMEDVKQYVAKRQRELKSVTLRQHSKAIVIVSAVTTIIYIVGLVTPEMIKGEFSCKRNDAGRTTSCDVAEWTDEQRVVQIGLWNAHIHGKDYAVCDEWPASDDGICSSIRAARAFVFLAIIMAILTTIVSVLRMTSSKHDSMPFKSVICLALSGFFGMIAYSIWQGSCHHQLVDMAKDATIAMFPTSLNKDNIRFWNTLGYSYCLILWAWVYSIGFIAVKVMLPGLENIEKKVQHRMSRGAGLHRTSF